MQIILVRHGKPDLSSDAWCAPRDMGEWVARYQRADVPGDRVPAETRTLARQTGTVVTSPLPRCVQSAEHLLGHRESRAEVLFAEAHLPYLDVSLPRLPVKVWRLGFRSAWFLGFAAHTESIARSSARARQAAAHLIELAEAHGSVMLVGHGIKNVLIAWHLRARGWAGPRHLILKDYWQPSCYRRHNG